MRVDLVGPSRLKTAFQPVAILLLLCGTAVPALPKCAPPRPGESEVNQTIGLLKTPSERAKAIETIYQIARCASPDLDSAVRQKAVRSLGRKKVTEAEGVLRILWSTPDIGPEIAEAAYIAWLELQLSQPADRASRIGLLQDAASKPWSCALAQFIAENLLDLGASESQEQIESTIWKCAPYYRRDRDVIIARTKLAIMREHPLRRDALIAALHHTETAEYESINRWGIDLLVKEGTPESREILLDDLRGVEQLMLQLMNTVGKLPDDEAEAIGATMEKAYEKEFSRHRPLISGLLDLMSEEEMEAAGVQLAWMEVDLCKGP